MPVARAISAIARLSLFSLVHSFAAAASDSAAFAALAFNQLAMSFHTSGSARLPDSVGSSTAASASAMALNASTELLS